MSLTSWPACVGCRVELGGVGGIQGAGSSRFLSPGWLVIVQARWDWSVWLLGAVSPGAIRPGVSERPEVGCAAGGGRQGRWCREAPPVSLGAQLVLRERWLRGPLALESCVSGSWPGSGSGLRSALATLRGSISRLALLSYTSQFSGLPSFLFRFTPNLHPQNFSLLLGSLWISSVQT